MRKTNHLFFADILSDISYDDFLDTQNNYSRLIQYQLGKYLASVDDGWVLRKGQYYRGAIQSEDEEAWGKAFFHQLLANDNLLVAKFYLIRQALRDVPHNGDTNIAQKMRSDSKILSDQISSFMDIRIKIHGRPEKSDIELVRSYYLKNKFKFSEKEKTRFLSLIETMETFYAPIDFASLSTEMSRISENNDTTQEIKHFLEFYPSYTSPEQKGTELANILQSIRNNILSFKKVENRLTVLDFSNEIENILLKEV